MQNLSQPDIERMQGCMFAGDLAAKKLSKKAICIVGSSRSGKSTLHNYLNGIPLIGQEINDGEDVIYKQKEENMGAETQYNFQSVTLVPNISKIYHNKQEISLVDFAGFNDENRSFVGLFGVNFMIQRFFKDLQQVKFILAIHSPVLQLSQISELIKPIEDFFRIFNSSSLLSSDYEKSSKRFISSISLVVIKSRDKERVYLAKLKKAIEFLDKIPSSEITKSRKLVRMLFDQIVKNNRISVFQRAVQGQTPEQSTILQKLEKGKWQYFSFEDPANIAKQELIKLPFNEELKNMKNIKPQDFQKYKQYSENKQKGLKEYLELVKQFVQNITKQTEDDQQDENGDKIKRENWLRKTIDYSHQFDKLNGHITNHPYGSWDLIYEEMKPQIYEEDKPFSVSRFQIIQPLKDIAAIIQQINGMVDQNYSPEKINRMGEEIRKILVICRDLFCRTCQQQKNFIIFEFLLQRTLYECEMQAKIDSERGSSIPFLIQQFTSKLLDQSIEDMKTKLLNQIKPENQQEKELYTGHMGEVLDNINDITDTEQAQKLSFLYVCRLVEKAKQNIKNSLFKEALEDLFQANEKFQTYITLVGDLIQEEEYKSRVSFKQNQIYKLIASALDSIGEFNGFVVRIYKCMKKHHLLSQHYERRIKKEKIKKKKLNLMEQYSTYLSQRGKFSRVEELYEQMLDTFDCFPEKMKEIEQYLKNLIQNKNQLNVEYEGCQYNRSDLEQIINELKDDLSMWQKEQEQVASISSDTEFEQRQK